MPGAQQGRMLLQGTIDRETGQAELQFIADFMFTAGFLYKAPPLKVSHALIAVVRQGASNSALQPSMGSTVMD